MDLELHNGFFTHPLNSIQVNKNNLEHQMLFFSRICFSGIKIFNNLARKQKYIPRNLSEKLYILYSDYVRYVFN